MANALACSKCGNTISSDRVQLDFDGTCPWCLATFALGDPSLEEPAPRAKASDRLGKYHLTEKLGTGGMGEVWKALDTELNRWVALKFLKDQDPKELARFTREAHMAAKLSHPGIAAVHEIGEIAGRRYIVMQCIEGRTLESFPRNDRRLLVRLCMEAAKALDHAHRNGVIHRDVKPANLMVEESAEGAKIVVLDFGLARPIEGGDKLSVSGSVVGTPQYLSPEQARAERLDERTDVYSLGVTMYEIFTGKAPFEAKNVYEILKKIENEEPKPPRAISPRVSPDLQKIILKCLEKDRERRYAGAKELADDLRRFLNHEAVLARPPSTIYRLRMKLSQRKALAAAVAAALILVVGGAILLTKLNAESQARARLVAYQSAYSDGRNAWDEVLQIVQRAPLERAVRKAREARSHFEKAIGILEQADAHVMRGKCHQLERNPREADAAWERALALDPANQEARFHLAKMLLLMYWDARLPGLASYDKSGGLQMVEPGPETREETRLRERAEKLLAGIGVEDKSIYLRGVLLINRLQYPEGADLLARYNLEGWDTASMTLEASARLFARDVDGVIRTCTRAIELDPKEPHNYVLRGLARESKRLSDDAIADLTKAIELDPGRAVAIHNLGNIKAERRQFDEAIADYTRAISLEPGLAVAYYSRANAKREKGLRDEAILDFNECINRDPTFQWGYVNRGIELANKRLHKEAIEDLDKAIALDPKDANAYCIRGGTKKDMGHHDDAIADCTKAIDLDPKSAIAYNNRGNAKRAKGAYDDAIADLTKSIDLDSKYPLAYCNRGIVKFEQGLFDDAIADCTKAIDLDPKYANAYNSRGNPWRAKGQLDQALADFNKAIELDPKDAVAYSNRGTLYCDDKGLPDLAIQDFKKAIELDPKFAVAYHNLGNAQAKKNLLDEAIANFTTSIDLNPKFATAYAARGDAKRAKGQFDAAIVDFAQAITLDGKDARIFYRRGNMYLARGMLNPAIEDFNTAILLNPKHAEALTNRGNAKRDLGRIDEAIADYMEAIKQDAKLALAWFNLGSAKSEKGLLDEAIEAYTKSIQLDTKFPAALYNRGNAKAAKALLNEAIDDFSAAIALDPRFPEAWANRAFAKARKGLIDEAIEDWRKALSVAPRGWSYREMVQGYVATRAAQIIFDEANRLHELKEYRAAIEKYQGLVESKSEYATTSAYNIACAYALLGEKKNALDWLEKAVEIGWKDLAHIEKDTDLGSLRNEDRYKKLAAKLGAR